MEESIIKLLGRSQDELLVFGASEEQLTGIRDICQKVFPGLNVNNGGEQKSSTTHIVIAITLTVPTLIGLGILGKSFLQEVGKNMGKAFSDLIYDSETKTVSGLSSRVKVLFCGPELSPAEKLKLKLVELAEKAGVEEVTLSHPMGMESEWRPIQSPSINYCNSIVVHDPNAEDSIAFWLTMLTLATEAYTKTPVLQDKYVMFMPVENGFRLAYLDLEKGYIGITFDHGGEVVSGPEVIDDACGKSIESYREEFLATLEPEQRDSAIETWKKHDQAKKLESPS